MHETGFGKSLECQVETCNCRAKKEDFDQLDRKCYSNIPPVLQVDFERIEKNSAFKSRRFKGVKKNLPGYRPGVIAPAVCAWPLVMDVFIMHATSNGHADGELLPSSLHGPNRLRHTAAFRVSCVEISRQTRPSFFTAKEIHTAAALIHSIRHYTAPKRTAPACKNAEMQESIHSLKAWMVFRPPSRSCFPNKRTVFSCLCVK